jgi:aprataxin
MSSQLKILRTYAKMDDASITKLPPTVYFSHTRHTLTIFDAYPKAIFHFLILPRLRAAASADDGDGDGDEDMGELTASATDLTSLRTLLQRTTTTTTTTTTTADGSSNSDNAHRRTTAAFSTLHVLADEAARLRREIEREMETRYGFVWDIWVGFHAVPSME